MSTGGGFFIVRQGYQAYFLLGAALTAGGAAVFWLYAHTPRGEYARRADDLEAAH